MDACSKASSVRRLRQLEIWLQRRVISSGLKLEAVLWNWKVTLRVTNSGFVLWKFWIIKQDYCMVNGYPSKYKIHLFPFFSGAWNYAQMGVEINQNPQESSPGCNVCPLPPGLSENAKLLTAPSGPPPWLAHSVSNPLFVWSLLWCCYLTHIAPVDSYTQIRSLYPHTSHTSAELFQMVRRLGHQPVRVLET